STTSTIPLLPLVDFGPGRRREGWCAEQGGGPMSDATTADQVVRSYPFGAVDRLAIDPMDKWLQHNEPLSRVRLPHGDEGWLLVRYDEVRTALVDPRFSLAEAVVRDVPRLHPQRVGSILTDLDPPEHTRLRRLVAKAFTA